MNKLMTKRLTGQLSLHSRRPLMTNESGRSMVEMLGVLAIVGVLSAGALKGYSDAMFKYKMNKTIDIATKMFQQFEEINQTDWGGSTSEDGYVEILTSDASVVSWGLLEKCESDGNDGCRLPIGGVYIELSDDPMGDKVWGCDWGGHQGEFKFRFTSAKECIAFASVHWEQMLPQEWFYPDGYVDISGSGPDLTYEPATGPNEILKSSDIANACRNNCANGTCYVRVGYRIC